MSSAPRERAHRSPPAAWDPRRGPGARSARANRPRGSSSQSRRFWGGSWSSFVLDVDEMQAAQARLVRRLDGGDHAAPVADDGEHPWAGDVGHADR